MKLRLKPGLPVGVVREVDAPNGTAWEISVSHFVPPEWDPGDSIPMFAGRFGYIDETPLAAVLNGLLLPLVRFSIKLPSAIRKGRDSKVIWIEASSNYPVHERYYWTTSADHVHAAVDEIAKGYAAGEIAPRTLRAFYFGTHRLYA